MLLEASIVLPLLLVAATYVTLILLSPSEPKPVPSEKTYLSTISDESLTLPSIHDAPTVELSVIVPAYNERKRIGPMLEDAVGYLEGLSTARATEADQVKTKSNGNTDGDHLRLPTGITKGSYEIIIVDDGSRDGTLNEALRLVQGLKKKWTMNGREMKGTFKLVKLVRNRGKGGTVKHGVLHASGCRILFADADGASHFPDLALLQDEMDLIEISQNQERLGDLKKVVEKQEEEEEEGCHGVVVGSRAHLIRTEAVVKRSFLRNLLMRLFHLYLYVLGIRSIRDTQCGFKLQTRRSAAHLYPYLHSPAWIFDCELLLLATLSGIPVREVGIEWREVDGSKVDLIKDSIGMAVDLLVIRANYFLGRWSRPAFVGLETRHASIVEAVKDK